MKISVAFSIFLAVGVLISLSAQSYPPDGWRVKMTIASTSEQQKFADMVIKGDAIHTIWIDNREGSYQVYYKKSTDAGFTWSTDIAISESGDIIPDAKRNISITGIDNYLYVVYATKTETPHSLRFCRSTDNGVSWSGYQDIAVVYNLPEPSIIADADSIRLVFRQGSYIVYTASGNHGNSWSSLDIIDAGGPYPECCPDIVTINRIPHVTFVSNEPGYGYSFHAKHTADGWITHNILSGTYPTVYYYPHILTDQQGYIYVMWEDTLSGPYTGRIICFASTDGGESWDGSDLGVSGKAGADFVIADRNRLLVVYGDANYIYGCYGNYTPGEGIDWESPFILEDISPVEPPACKPHCCIAKGDIAKHLIFHIGYGNNQDLAYMANDDLLLSDDNRATAFNNGRHLIRDPNTGSLHLVYHSQNRVHYSMSDYTGENWTPYHILEDPETQQKDEGWYPSIGLVPGWLVAKMPCIVYCSAQGEVKYRWLEDGTQQWHGFTILSAQTGLDPGPPSVVTYGDTVYVVFSVNMLEGEQLWSAIYFYQFPYYAIEPPAPMVLDYELGGPLAYKHASITVDGNRNPHVVWDKWISWTDYEIYYRWRENGNWYPIELVSNYPSTEYPDKSPYIDCYGNWLSVVWYDEIFGTPNEIWRRRKQIYPESWQRARNYSDSPEIISEYPVNASDDFFMWCEIGNASDYDIRYRSDTYGFGWVSQAPEKEYFCHSQLQRDYSPWDLYTIFTRGNTTPYQIVCAHQQFGSGPPGGESPLYIVETGNDSISPFCLHRDGIITYANYSVDYGTSELIYELCLLDPTFPFHKVKGTAYFQGNGNRTYELWINGVKKHTLTVKPNIPYDFEVLIPKELYQNNNRINLTIKNPNNTGVSIAGLRVYRKPDGKSGGGPQSSYKAGIQNVLQLTVMPNPFKEKTVIRYSTGEDRPISMNIYDAVGRLVKRFDYVTMQSSNWISWNGCDDKRKHLPCGIYFLELKFADKSITKQIILLK